MQIFLLIALSQFAALPLPAEMTEAREWAEARWLDPAKAPFSFVYDGKPSAELLGASSGPEKKVLANGAVQESRVYSVGDAGLQVRVESVICPDFPVLEYVVYLKNTGAADTPIIEQFQALDMTAPVTLKDPVLYYAKGATCSMEDYRPMQRVLNKGGRTHLEPGGGRSSSDFLPFFNLVPKAEGGMVLALGWSGEWAADFAREHPDEVHVRAGMALTHLRLHPGEEIRTPRIAVLLYQGERMRGQNLLRGFILAHHRPTVNGKAFDMPMFNGNWGGTRAEDHLKNIQAIANYDLPFDYYWIDAEWFGTGRWHQTAGDWRVKQDLYPEGFKPLSDSLHQSGRKLLLWFEPERVCEGTPWYTEHAPWLLDIPKERRAYNWGASQAEPDWVRWESLRNQIKENDRLFNLALPEARAFLTDFISSKIDEFGLDCFRHDANIAPLEFWRAADAPDRQGITEIRWIEGLYAFWDALLERHPGLIIDNCASGGRRVDLESIGRSTPFWRTDYAGNVTGKQCHTYGISFWVPLNATGGVNPARDGAYAWRSSISSSIAFGLFGNGDAAQALSVPADFPAEAARKLLLEYRSLQKYYLGDYYPLTEYSQAEDAWIAWQFDRPDLGEGMAQVFRRPGSICESGRIRLHGLDPETSYAVTNVDTQNTQSMRGGELSATGFSLSLNEAPASAILTYKRVP